MQKILEILLQDEQIKDIATNFSRRKEFLVYGLSGVQKTAVIAAAYKKNPCPTIILFSEREKISEWKNNLSEFLTDAEILELPEVDLFPIKAETAGLERFSKRLEIFSRLARGENLIVLASAISAVKKDFSRENFFNSQIKIKVGQKIQQENLISQLVKFGYERIDDVDSFGKFSVRGGIVDIFPINSPKPCRLEFFDDVVDSIRILNSETLRSEKNISAVNILPIKFEVGKIFEPFMTCAESPAVIFDEPARIKESIDALTKENPALKKKIFTFDELIKNSRAGSLIYLQMMLKKISVAELDFTFGITAAKMTAFNGQKDFFISEIRSHLDFGRKIFIISPSEKKLDKIKNILDENNFINFSAGSLSEGFIFQNSKLVVITEKDIFGSQFERKKIRTKYPGEQIRNFRDINIGDYVVHETNGIGKYLGVETLEFEGVKKDYLQIQYGGGDKLYLPTDTVKILQKYISGENFTPKLSTLGSGDWIRAKSRASAAVEDIADKLIEIYAERKAAKGFAFAEDDDTQIDFEKNFPYEETQDQLKALAEVKKDMENEKPMDRLICGDVGFGKTEIAIRAAYKAAMNGKQVALLVPTTVLAQQHFQTFSERFAGFLPTVDVICRFRTPKEQRTTLQKVRAGQIDILIGTHSILNSKVEFKNLGLLIIDEEQRFGVKQKEKIRSLSAGVDVLALSATPIPRTLHMSLVSARDMSLITTPPAERFPVQTYVIEDEDEIISEAIRREIHRGGQVYFVYNKIETIDLMHERLSNLIPEAKIQTAHGQLSDVFLENVMMDFYEGKFDVLLSTTIIENGLDIPNANTIIIYDADNFGLAQLYQMRGRVGRSNQTAFAYFVHRKMKVLTETAEKRLHAMKEFAQLGAGFKIAMRDLEIRGAGNLLGSQQHGHIASVGFEMYCQLLENAVNKLQNKIPEKIIPDTEVNLSVEAYLDEKFISSNAHKIEIYQRLAVVKNSAELRDLTDEIIDRFGDPPEPVINLFQIAKIKFTAKNLDIQSIQEKNSGVEFIFNESAKISPKNFIELKNIFKNRFKDYPSERKIFIKLDNQKNLFKIIFMVLKKLSV
ncbi:MAG: transcription-repair coupling factor [Selenomonadaceae bacterium]|nr:transcription-repair coupling factor [Selenomonadaceae bacterium]